jgi:hypothetical protein
VSSRYRKLVQAFMIVIATAIAFSVAPAGDREFNLIAHHLELHSHGRRALMPFLGVANLFAPITRPAAFRRLKVASFDSPSLSEFGDERLAEIIRGSLGPAWRPLLRHQIRRTGEQAYIFFRASETSQELIIVEVNSTEAILIQAALEPEQFARYLARPDEMGRQIEAELPPPAP